jgi:hypothetical protein
MKHSSTLREKCKKFQLVNREKKEDKFWKKRLLGRITGELNGLDLSISV